MQGKQSEDFSFETLFETLHNKLGIVLKYKCKNRGCQGFD